MQPKIQNHNLLVMSVLPKTTRPETSPPRDVIEHIKDANNMISK